MNDLAIQRPNKGFGDGRIKYSVRSFSTARWFLCIFLQHCSGPNQSPIAIHSRRSIPMNIPAIEFVFYHNLLPGSIKIHNNGHSLSLITPKPENFTQFPFVFGGKLRAEYEYVGLHFHWGDKNNRGSVRFISAIAKSRKALRTEAFRGLCGSDVNPE